ncbi:uncharacterized protein VP01_2257g5 [Puccinia sorghi]|uniref:hAT-like transposase RNase-H fold domain-containing protein n=1 Tax=Puccinia sorghi TaxID=27349 RepID=A0A0L6V8A7_9BASI|nr:uncharacterized protein VP01_2257g5 [Puccinia sorghi]
MQEITLGIPHLIGSNSGENFAILFQKSLDQFECTRKLFSITTDNTLTNNKMVKWIENKFPEFNHKTHLLGCFDHVINLAAKSALAILGTNKEDEEGNKLPTSVMDEMKLKNDDLSKYMINNNKWEQSCHIVHMLDPLGAATELLCGSEYPTLNSALPIYLILMKRLTIIQNGLYDQGQLIEPTRKMFEKLNQYL